MPKASARLATRAPTLPYPHQTQNMSSQFVSEEAGAFKGRIANVAPTGYILDAGHNTTRQHNYKRQGKIGNGICVPPRCGDNRNAPITGGSQVDVDRSSPGNSHHPQAGRSIQNYVGNRSTMHEQNLIIFKSIHQLLRIPSIFADGAFGWS